MDDQIENQKHFDLTGLLLFIAELQSQIETRYLTFMALDIFNSFMSLQKGFK